MTPRKSSPVAASIASGMATMEREVKMFLGLPPYQHDQNTAKGNAGYFDDLVARYGSTVVQTTMQRLSKEYATGRKDLRGHVMPPLRDTTTGRTVGETVDAAVEQYRATVAPPQPARAKGGIRLVALTANDYAVVIRIGQTDLTLSREATPTDAKRVAAEFCEKLARVVMQL